MSTTTKSRQKKWQSWAFYTVLVPTLAEIALFGGVYTWVWVPALLVFAFSAAALVVACTLKKEKLPFVSALWPVLGFGILVALQWVCKLSIYPGITLTGLLQLYSYGSLLYLGLFAFSSGNNLRRLLGILYGFSAALAIETIFQYFTSNKYIYWVKDATYATPTGPYIYHNHFAGCMDLLLPVTVAYAFKPRSQSRLSIQDGMRRSLVPALILASIIVSQSRGGLIILLLESLAGLIVFWPYLREKKDRRKNVVLAGAFLIGFSLLAGWQPILNRFAHLRYHDISALDRLHVDRTCLAIWSHSPWTGSGFGTFPVIYPQFQSFDDGKIWVQAHNEYLQMLAETGIIGIALVFLFLIIGVRQTIRSTNTSPPHHRIWRKAVGIGTFGFLIHSVGDFQFHCPANASLFFLFCAVLLAPVAVHTTGHDFTQPERAHLKLAKSRIMP